MKTTDKSAESNKSFDQLISKFSENEILNTHAMSCVRGGEGEANGGGQIIIIPK